MKTDASQGLERKTGYLLTTKQWKLIKNEEKEILCGLVWEEPQGRDSAIWLATTEVEPWPPLFFFLFFLFLCGNDGAQQSIAGSGRIQAPFHCMPMLITPNNRFADGASLEIRRCPYCSVISLFNPIGMAKLAACCDGGSSPEVR